MITLNGKTAVVTGATSGIGRAISLQLARESVHITAIARTETKLKALADDVAGFGSKLNWISADFAEDAAPDRLVREIRDKVDHVDILVHSAGYLRAGTVEESQVADLDRHFLINFRAPYLLTKGLLPDLIKRKAQVVFINSSVCFQVGKPGLSAYTASKYAVKALADSLRGEVNSHGVRVLSIYPGRTATAMQADIYQSENKIYSPEKLLQPEDIAEQVVHALKMPMTAEVTDISIRPLQKIP